ncbi:hypothetical protein TRIUR3_28901 [Triticum urartu]|uniref:Uncharacterized protein n=1 Tax=Triticum urartu TaxID=4572 RepID=M7ZQ03_TRIUA|nr:hypothetical protein TRIUR3_28901 [Triticum urartu]
MPMGKCGSASHGGGRVESAQGILVTWSRGGVVATRRRRKQRRLSGTVGVTKQVREGDLGMVTRAETGVTGSRSHLAARRFGSSGLRRCGGHDSSTTRQGSLKRQVTTSARPWKKRHRKAGQSDDTNQPGGETGAQPGRRRLVHAAAGGRDPAVLWRRRLEAVGTARGRADPGRLGNRGG